MGTVLKFPNNTDDDRLELAALGLRICAEIDTIVAEGYPDLPANERGPAWQATAIGIILSLLEPGIAPAE